MPTSFRLIALLACLCLLGFGFRASASMTDGRWLSILGVGWMMLIVVVWARLPPSLPVFSRTVLRTALVLVTGFAIVSVQLVRIQFIQANAIVNRSATTGDQETISNPRLQTGDLLVKRGRVFDRTGRIVADSVAEEDIWRRVYPEPESAYVVGYYSPLLYGKAGLEASYDDELTGREGNNAFLRWTNDLLHRPQEGLDLHLTLDVELQRTAHELLDGRAGGVVLLDVETGAVRAMASNPVFDPNRLFTNTPGESAAAGEYWAELVADRAAPLVERTTNGLYAPGSTFKVVSAAAAIDAGFSNPDKIYEDDGSLDVEGRVIVEQNRPDDSINDWTLRDGLAWSLNVVFAQVGLELGANAMRDYAERFGFGAEVPFDVPVETSQLASSPEFLDSAPALADTAFGQGELLVTPLQMALVAAAVANDGTMMRPYLIDRIATDDGETTERRSPREWRQSVGAETAAQVREMMVYAVEEGYGQGARIDGLVVGGKTGTAETGDDEPHAWFIGFVGDPEPRFAVAVVLERGGSGLGAALGVGRDLMQAAMTQDPPLASALTGS